MKKVKKILPYVFLAVLLAAGSIAIIAATKSQTSRRCKGLLVDITNDQVHIDDKMVLNWATNYNAEPLDGKVLRDVDLRALEKRILRIGSAKSCEVYFDVEGKVVFKVEVFEPVARILMGGHIPDKYMSKEGDVFPLPAGNTPTVLLIGGDFFKDFTKHSAEKHIALTELVNFVTEDEFWNAQITQLSVDANQEIIMYPHLGDHKIIFGTPERIEPKFEKLVVFYKKILPMSKWNSFSEINLKYQSQIVCK